MNEFKCKYCGQEIKENIKIVQVITGEIKSDKEVSLFTEDTNSDVEHYHKTCFLSLTNDPDFIDML